MQLKYYLNKILYPISWHNRNMKILVLVSFFSLLLHVGFARIAIQHTVRFAEGTVSKLRKYEQQARCHVWFLFWNDPSFNHGVCRSFRWVVHAT